MKLELITLLGIKIDRDVYEVIIPTLDGEIGIFPGHEPIVGVVKPGAIVVRYEKADRDNKLEYFAVSGGIAEISQTRVRILVDEAENGADIIEAESKAALEKALQLQKTVSDQVGLEKATQLVDRHAVRLKVAELQRRHYRNR